MSNVIFAMGYTLSTFIIISLTKVIKAIIDKKKSKETYWYKTEKQLEQEVKDCKWSEFFENMQIEMYSGSDDKIKDKTSESLKAVMRIENNPEEVKREVKKYRLKVRIQEMTEFLVLILAIVINEVIRTTPLIVYILTKGNLVYGVYTSIATMFVYAIMYHVLVSKSLFSEWLNEMDECEAVMRVDETMSTIKIRSYVVGYSILEQSNFITFVLLLLLLF